MAFPPAIVSVDGTTVLTKAFLDAYNAEVDSALVDAGDPTRTPAQTTAEVIAARGNLASVNARLSGVVDADGNPIGSMLPNMVRNGFVLGNLLANDTGLMWSRGDTSAPDFWTMAGTGAAVARCGVGQADTEVLSNMDHFSMRLTYGSDAATLTQEAITATMASGNLDQGFLNRYLPCDASGVTVPDFTNDTFEAYVVGHVWCNGTGRARLRVLGGSVYVESPFHPGDGAWHSLVAGPLGWSVSASKVAAQARVVAAGAAYFQAISLILTPLGLPPMYIPAVVRLREYTFPIIAIPAAATGYGYFVPSRPFFALGMTASVLGAVPTGGTTLKLDLMTPISGTFQSLFSTLPTFVASDRHLIQACDPAAANYRRRTIRGVYAAGGAASLADNSVLRLDVNTRDSGNTATNVLATVIGVEYVRPLDQFRTMTDLGE